MKIVVRFFRSKWGKRLAIALLILVSILTPSAYYAQTQGVCLKAGRILSEEELRKIALANTVNFYFQDAYHYNWSRSGIFSVGINSPAQETDMLKLINAAYNSGKSFEENFGLKVLMQGREKKEYKKLTDDQLREPFIFMVYESIPNGVVTALVSPYFKEIAFNELEPELQEAARKKINFFTTLSGYGNHYFNIVDPASYNFIRICCDNNMGSSYSEYLKHKQEAYEMALHSASDPVIRNIQLIGMVSNCGEFMPGKRSEIGILGDVTENEH
ncbi:MAG: hypothetical protein LBG78_05500 [Azoarcus sp.]|jgi:hypothetical protein|nr:hypothetical protein [Azoarcus sp.]